ncbi:YqiA/YcfP family alpha/beta fold hydrolase [Ralstonia sp. GX3-BWBA]|uniref:YqiA/YcfP family alpha/beta fold hydrolase n=1 Tax=Ralstonia sp. GX3-BWBA TaxID=2219865 RepID=UPI000DD35753|nr:YqiA/YcfP family alpha/beta fold hydrolase [Ralstonia sp. GX3-BWBA]
MPASIIYLHGFRSSPRSFKAQLLAKRMASVGLADQYVCPTLPVSPSAAMAEMEALIAELGARDGIKPVLIGSSLGGFYATWLAERHGLRAAMLNPATRPERDLAKYVGEQPLWHGGGTIRVEPHHLDELQALAVSAITQPERYYLLAATGDEVLDYREMLGHFPGATTRIIEGGDHGISDFAQYMDEVLVFCGVPADLLAAHPFSAA